MVNFGLTLSNRGVVTGASTLDDMIALARRADADERWDSIWVGDSILAKPRLDALNLMSALAVVTDRVRIGPACFASTPLRDALLLAYQYASLDFMSNGRAIFAACMGQAAPGGGDMLHEFDAFCVAPESRMKRMEEAIEIMRLLTSEENVSYHGEYNDFDNVTIEPRSVQRPIPIWVTSNPRPDLTRNREAGLRRTARLGDGWMTTFQPPAIVEEYLADIHRYADEEGRQLPDDFETCVYYNINVNDDRQASLAESRRYLEAYYNTEYSDEMLGLWVAMGTPNQCIADIQSYIDAGATTITLRLVGYDQQSAYDRVVNEVLPAFD
ncbi:MAG: LLM class flavin-dependent oxidoreductase [Chloroflexota bacterium]|nr:LLM class flavin-dependent oxidoreductase [Chloroflexota bacterium]